MMKLTLFCCFLRRSLFIIREGLRRQGIETSLDGIAPFRVPERTAGPVPDRDLSPGDLAPRPATGDKNGYVYHLGPAEYIDSYRATGLETRASGDIPSWLGPPELSEGRLFFADSIDRARELVWRPGDNIAFRVKASDVGDVIPEQSFSGSQWAKKGIPPEKIEVLNGHGEWVPLTSASKMLPSGLRQAVDNASRDFALGQVKRVMFDFTRQSRFTELLQFAFPFPQPFFEGFQAWGHIAWRNPEAIGRALVLTRTAYQVVADMLLS